MPDWIIWVFLAAVLFIAVPSVFYRLLVNRKKKMMKRAFLIGFEFLDIEKDAEDIAPGMWLWEELEHARIENAMVREIDGGKIMLADLSHFHRGGTQARTMHSSVSILTVPGLDMSHCSLHPQGFFEGFAQSLGLCKDIHFADDTDFDKKYVIKAEDENAVQRFLNEPLRQWLKINHTIRPFTIEMYGETAVMHEEEADLLEQSIQAWRRALTLENTLRGRLLSETLDNSLRRRLCSLVEKYCKRIRNEKIYLWPFIPTGLVQKAKETFAMESGEDEFVLGLIDNTVLGSAKTGLLITDQQVYAKNDLQKPKSAVLDKLTQAESKLKFPDHAIFLGEEELVTLGFSKKTVEELVSLLSELGTAAGNG